MKAALFLFLVAPFLVAEAAGFLAAHPPATPPTLGDYQVLAGDFHIHMFPLDDTTLAPWDVVLEARRRGLGVIALTGHNQVWTAKVGRWFAQLTGGPMVLVGEEMISPSHHIIAVGIQHNIDWRGSAAETIAEIHRQGGVAIAAHPLRDFWPAFDDAAMAGLDGAEVLHPMAFADPEYAAEFREFYERKPLTAIGSSDFHGIGYPGFSRTYVFVHQVSEQAVLNALRTRQTVAIDRDGHAYGDPELVKLGEANGGLPRSGILTGRDGWSLLSRAAAIAGMLVALLFGMRD